MLNVKREALITPTHDEIMKPSSAHLEYGPQKIQTEALVVMAAKEPFTMMPITLDEVRSDEYLIEMKYSGLCHTVRDTPASFRLFNLLCARTFGATEI